MAPSSIYLFDRATGLMTSRITGLPNVVNRLVYSPDGHCLAAVCASGGLRVYSASDGSLAGKDEQYSNGSYGVTFGPKAL